VVASISTLPGIDRVYRDPAQIAALGLANKRSGNVIVIAQYDAWFAHDFWASDSERPAWQLTVDIHRKPGYDPRELFFDPAKKCIAQSLKLIKGSHGRVDDDPASWPVLICDPAFAPPAEKIAMTDVAAWLKKLLD
jgi:hypothetical protein